MKSSALLAVLALGFSTTSAARAADVRAECAAAWKAAQSDKAAGKLVKAAADLATCSRTVCPRSTQAQCTKLAAAVDTATPTIVVSAEDASKNAVTDATVSVDGDVVADALDGKPIAVDPGHHTLHVESKGATPVGKDFDATAGQKGQALALDLDSNPPAPPPAPVVVKEEPVPGSPGTMTETDEDPSKTYYFVGLRYRGDVVPSFIIDLFVNNAQTVYTNAIALELDIRRHGFSMVPSLTYAEFGTPNMIIQQKSDPAGDAGSWSLINSGLAGVFGSVQLLWSIKLVKHWDLELGTELGLGAIFGNLVNNWVYTPGDGPGKGFNPANALPCTTATQGNYGCSSAQHSNNTPPHIDGFDEPSWVNGGSKPNIFPMVNFPQIGVRYKPIKQLETRLATGFSLTGFWFSLSADYGLETLLK